ncbi:uncharacterized protein LOC131608117 [Vicia villosa]|uniref:uncharacterized protein LOC131608117 n=1 Tax=Vicia villosa TaxID=3911 RepID=UPI00273CC1DA|nr:uncharacterized protein LOC131608117 [Vicia villosa]
MVKSQRIDSFFKRTVAQKDDNVIHAENSDQIRKNRLCLETSIDITRFLTIQDWAFCGEGETSEERNQDAFLSLLKLTASGDDELAKVVSENSPYLSKCTSFQFQKEVLRILSGKVKKYIREEIGDSKFCVVLDGVCDKSYDEQMAIVLRFVDKDGFIQERFFDIVCVEDFNPLALKKKVCDVLSRHNLDVSNVRGQGYDGTSDMREQWNDLQALFLNECPYAYYIHCFAHKLELALVGASTEVRPIQQFYSQLTRIVKFFCTCRKPHDELLAAELDGIAHLLEINELETGEGEDQRVGDTRSRSFFSPICSLINMYDATCCVLEKLTDDGSNYCQRGDAHIAYCYFTTFEFVLILHMMKDIMGITVDLCEALQQQSLDLVNVKHLVCSTKALLNNIGQDDWDKLLKKVTSFCEKNDVTVPQLNAPYVERPRRSSRQQEDHITLEHYYRDKVFFIVIGKQIQELNSRFSEQAMEVLTLSSGLVPKGTYDACSIDNICILVEKYYPMDFNCQEKIDLRSQLQHFTMLACQESTLKSLLTIQELCAYLVARNKSELFYLVERLFRLVMTLPVFTPTTERSSSAMKIFKSMLKNMMEDEFLADSMIIYIEREIAKSFSCDSIINDLESLEERSN